jgi:hypothetical protein
MQVDQSPHTVPTDPNLKKAQSELQSLDGEIKKGDAQKAEMALSTAKSAVKDVQTQKPAAPAFSRGVNVYA